MARFDATVKNYLVYRGLKCEESAESCIIKLIDSFKRAELTKTKYIAEPLVWQEPAVGAQFHVTAVSVYGGSLAPVLVLPQDAAPHNETESNYTITLHLTIDARWEKVIPINLRMIDESGNLLVPSTQQFIFPDTNGSLARANAIYRDQQVVFIAPISLKKFTFTTVGNDGVFFTVKILPNNDIDVRYGL